MAIYHLSVKAVSRSEGRSATAAAAYRAGCSITDERTGEIYDYIRKGGIESAEIVIPDGAPEWARDRAKLWNSAELSEKRKDACVAREFEAALPIELSAEERRQLTVDFAREMANREGCAVDVCIHGGNGENPHAHILRTTRKIGVDGLGEKLDTEKAGRGRRNDLEEARKRWEELANAALERAGQDARIDHRSLAAQGIDRTPQIHIGPHVPEMEARGIQTERGSQALAIEAINDKGIYHERNYENTASPERGADRRGTRTAGAGDGRVDGRDAADAGRDRAAEPGARRELPPADRDSGAGVEDRRDGSADGGAKSGQRWAANGVEDLRHSSTGRDDYGGARDRVLALAVPGTENPEHARPGGSGRAPEAGPDRSLEASPQGQVTPDRTYLAARRQLDAMGVEAFEVGIRDRDGRMMTRSWPKTDVLKAIPWLKRENAKGADIYVRPATGDDQNAGLVLLDDIDRGTLKAMQEEGYAPAAVIETSPDNFQAWIRLAADRRLPAEVATLAAKRLAKHYGGDPNSADWRHFGRLAGFTNRKPAYTDERGRNPWVLAHECPGKAAENAYKLISQCEAVVDKAEAEKECQRRLNALEASKSDGYASRYDPLAEYQRQAQRLIQRYGRDADFSRLDWMIATDMAKSGRFTTQDIEKSIRECSPHVESRKTGHVEDYARRTAAKAWTSPEVVASRQEYGHDRSDDHGMSR